MSLSCLMKGRKTRTTHYREEKCHQNECDKFPKPFESHSDIRRDFPDVQCLRVCPPSAEGPGSIPGQGTRAHLPYLSGPTPQLKLAHATTKIGDGVCCN